MIHAGRWRPWSSALAIAASRFGSAWICRRRQRLETPSWIAAGLRPAVELLNAAYALHPAFGEAEIVELGADLRPAFADNLPQVRRDGRVLRANGLFRHGFLLAPELARQVADAIKMETNNADIPERRRA